MLARTARRWTLYLGLAALLHGAALLGRGCVPTSAAAPKVALDPLGEPVDVTELGLDQEPAKVPPGPAPGGGSILPQPGPRASAPEQRVRPLVAARWVERARERQARVETGERSEDPALPRPFATDTLTSDLVDPSEGERPRAARRQLLADTPQIEPRGAPEAALQSASTGRSRGTGFGANGGPGGPGRGDGRGSGVIEKRFAFGGPSGAFRADVCFIEPSVRLLTDITVCTPVATFFTSELNVSPRRFDRGFPGLGQRTEWFAIKFSGKFKVGADDSYTFRLLSDDGARLEIDGRPVLDNDGQHLPIAVSRNLRLTPGEHDFFLFYYQGPPDFVALQLFVKRFAHDEQLFGPAI